MRRKSIASGSPLSWACRLFAFFAALGLLFEVYLLVRSRARNDRKFATCRKWQPTIQDYLILRQQNIPPIQSTPLRLLNSSIVIEPSGKCRRPRGFFIVHSQSAHLDERNFIRNKYLKEINPDKASGGICSVFVISAEQPELSELHNEAKQFDDLLVVDGIDSYHNITHKTRAWIRWLNDRHSGVQFVFKFDDDVQLEIQPLMRILEFFDRQRNVILCRVFPDGQISRNPESKWFLSRFEYAQSSLGTYCQGMAYAFSGNLLSKMSANIFHVQYLWMDDWYVTRALMNGTNAIYVDIGKHFVSANGNEDVTYLLTNGTARHEPIFGHFRPSNR
ncbi:Glycosyl transferase domain containing protein [Aphelenchoides besseyi]|nr:Glycosyl transferase domain containing protein [Aphelenchoides besseyi]